MLCQFFVTLNELHPKLFVLAHFEAFYWIDKSAPLYVNWSTNFVHAKIASLIVLKQFLRLRKLEILQSINSNKPL